MNLHEQDEAWHNAIEALELEQNDIDHDYMMECLDCLYGISAME